MAWASWMAVEPMPLLPPWTRKFSPGLSLPVRKALSHTVNTVSGRVAASSGLQPLGMGRHCPPGTATYSA
ncbi:hypothetical protein ACQ86N_23555 [Puia sp. P3]|uniref:hypothetical protein n=1 Tax=Puia sp. P3 TaxID=3423952 RepID=UPI003D67D2E8